MVRVPGNSSRGTRLRAERTGVHVVRYVRGAYSTYSARRTPAGASTWSTTVALFRDGVDQWGGYKDQNLRVESALAVLGDGGQWRSPWSAEDGSRNVAVSIRLDRGDRLILLAIDQWSRYDDNEGVVLVELVPPSPSAASP